MTSTIPTKPAPSRSAQHGGSFRVAYLLADAGIALADSKKGGPVHARSMIRAFAQESCAVDVYVMRRGKGDLSALETAGATIREVPRGALTRWWQARMLPGDGRPASNWATAVSWRLWQRDLFRAAMEGSRKHPPDLIYARNAWFAWPYAALARRLGVPLFLEVNAVLSVEKKSYGEAAFEAKARRIERDLFRVAERVLPVSAELARQAETLGADPARIALTPNAVDAELFSPAPAGAEHPAGQWVVGAACSMRAYHGIGTLLQAAAKLRDEIDGLRLLLIGGGPLLDDLKKQASALGIAENVDFAGVIAHEEVARRLRACDACVCPNQGEANQYNCPMKIFEYMAMKIPVVASRWGDIPNIVADGRTGLLHAPGDPDSLAAALLNVYRDPEAARQRAETAFAETQPRTWRAIARRVLEWTAAAQRTRIP